MKDSKYTLEDAIRELEEREREADEFEKEQAIFNAGVDAATCCRCEEFREHIQALEKRIGEVKDENYKLKKQLNQA